MRTLLFIFLPFLCLGKSFAETLSLNEAMHYGKVVVSGISNGGHMGKCLFREITSQSKRNLNIIVNPGFIMTADSAAFQDLVLTGHEKIMIAPGKKHAVPVFALSVEAGKSIPEPLMGYTARGKGTQELQAVTGYIARNMLQNHTGQLAVWVVTDGYHVGGIHHQNKSLQSELKKMLSSMTGRQLPWYQVKYPALGSNIRKEEHPAIIEGHLEYYLKSKARLSLGIYNEKGDLVLALFDNRRFESGNQHLSFEWHLHEFQDGHYQVRLTNGHRLIMTRQIHLYGIERFNN